MGVGGEIRAVLGDVPPAPQKKPKIRPSPQSRQRATDKNESKQPDSTWFFPVGSSVVHLTHGAGTVLAPPPNNADGEMLVRVKFAGGKEVDVLAMGTDLFPN